MRPKIIEFMGGKCEYCGYDTCAAALELHHRNPFDKESDSFRSLNEQTKKELKKCDLVCCVCHREVHTLIELMKEEFCRGVC